MVAINVGSIMDILKTILLSTNIKATLTSGAALALIWIIRDQHRWTTYGTGGTPPTWAGYYRMTKFRLQRLFSLDDLTDHTAIPSSGPTYLSRTLPMRSGPRPALNSWTLPQRQQLDHPTSSTPFDPALVQRLKSLTTRRFEADSSTLRYDASKTEGGTTSAIYARDDHPAREGSTARDKILGHEIAHVHSEDLSLHVWLSEADCKEVVRKGWGERFPLSALGLVHRGWSFVYAPRDMEECDVVEEIVGAGIAFVTGVAKME